MQREAVKMRRLIFFIILLAAMAACGSDGNIENMPEISVPPIIIADVDTPEDLPILVVDDTPLPEPDIPTINEYTISLDFEPETRMVFGMQSVRYTNRTDTVFNELVFRAHLNAWDGSETPYTTEFEERIFRRGRDYGFMEISHVSQDNEELSFILRGTVLTIRLARPLEPDETIHLNIQFEAYIPAISHRIGANEQAVWIGGAFLPVEAVFGPGGWHREPYYPVGRPFIQGVANYIVDITTPIGFTVAGTGTKTENYLYDRKITTFTAHLARDFAFAISPYFHRSGITTPSGVGINLYHYTPDLDVERILYVAAEAVLLFEETVGPYLYPNLCIVETDMFRAGEAFSSIIFMDSNHLRTSPTLHSLRNEIGRQWFSIIIGGNPVEEAWLNGGLTLLLQENLLGQPELRSLIERDYIDLQEWQHLIYNEDSRRIASRINSYERWTDYFRIQHRKARIMFYALYQEMGQENFMYLLREYYRQFAFQIATSRDFMELAEEIYGRSLRTFFTDWLYTTDLPDLP